MDPADRQFLDSLTRVTDANLADEAFGVPELARKLGINRTGLYRKVKILTQKSISQFIREQRLRRAMELLKVKSLNISEIAFATGFGSVAYFSRCFHEYYGCQPVEAKKRMAGETVAQNREDDILTNGIPEKGAAGTTGTTNQKWPRITSKVVVFAATGVLFFIVLIITIISINRFPDKSIAILPFINDSKDSANTSFNDGIAESIRDRLANIRDLEVKSRMTTDSYKNKNNKRLRRIAREMRVRYIVEGSSQKLADEVLITVQLIDARKDKHLFSRQYKKKYVDVFSLYGEIALEVAEEIRAVITTEEKKKLTEQLPENLETFKLVIHGQDLIDRTAESYNQRMEFLNQAKAGFQKALVLDSTNSGALAGLAQIYLNNQNQDSALILADKAIGFNKEIVKAYLVKSEVYLSSRIPDNAEKNLKLALTYDPGNIQALHLLGGIQYSRGEFYESFKCLLKSGDMEGHFDSGSSPMELSLLQRNILLFARALFALGFYEEGKEYALKWYELSFDVPWGYYYNLFAGGIVNGKFEEVNRLGLTIPEKELCLFYMGMNLIFMNQYQEALDYLLKIKQDERLNGRFYHRIFYLEAFAYLKTGDQQKADEYFRLSEYFVDTLVAAHPEIIKTENIYAIMDRYWRSPMFIRTANAAARGDKAKALGYLRELRKNFPASDLQVVTFLKLFPMFDNIRHEPEFQDYLTEAEKHYLSERRKVEKLLKEEGIID